MKTLLVVIAVIIAAYFLYFNKPEEQVPSSSDTKAAEGSKKSAPPKKTHEFPANTLCRKLLELQDKKFDKNELSHLHYSYPSNFNIAKARTLIANNQDILQEVKDLARFTAPGMSYTGDPEQLLPWLTPLRTAGKWLLSSAEVNAHDNKKTAAKKDFEDLAKILNTFISGESCYLHLLVASAVNEHYRKVLQRCNLTQQDKQELLGMLPDRKKYAAAVQATLETEKKIIRQIHKSFKNKDAVVLKMIDQNAQKNYKQFSEKRLAQTLDKFCAQLNREFAAGTLSAQTKFNIGSAKENAAIVKLISPKGIIKLSKRLK